jgi:sporulation integral membrane protein YtvI
MLRYLRRVIIWVLIGFLVYAFWRWYSGLLMPFVLALLFALWLDPVVSKLEQWGLSRGIAALLVLGSSIAALFVMVVLLALVLVTELRQLAKRLPAIVGTFERALHSVMEKLGQFRRHVGYNHDLLRMPTATLSHLVEALLRSLVNFLLHLPDTMLMLMVAVMAAFFIMRDKEQIIRHLTYWMPPTLASSLFSIETDISSGALGFVKAQMILVGLTAFGTTTGLVLLKFHYSVLIGLLSGVLDFIPYMGPTTILVPWATIEFLMGHGITALKILSIIFGLAAMRQIAEPRLVGQKMGFHPLVAIFSLYLGVRFFGPVGFVVGPISAVIIRTLAEVLGPTPPLDSGSL